MARCVITPNQLCAEMITVNQAAIKSGQERASLDVFIAHMKSRANVFPVTEAKNDAEVDDYWTTKYTSFRAETSVREKAFRTGKIKKNKKLVDHPINVSLANHLKEALEMSKLGAAPKKSSAETWASIGSMIAAIKAKKPGGETAGNPS